MVMGWWTLFDFKDPHRICDPEDLVLNRRKTLLKNEWVWFRGQKGDYKWNKTEQNIYPSYLLYILLTIGPHKPKQKEEKITYKCAKTQGSTFKRLWFWFSWIFILKRKDIGLTSWSQQIFQSLRILAYSSKILWILSIQNALQFFKIKYHHTCLKLHKFK